MFHLEKKKNFNSAHFIRDEQNKLFNDINKIFKYKGDMLANGIVEAVKELDFKLPLVVRFQGTNATQGRDIINKSQANIVSIDDLTKATKKVVDLAI